MPSRKMRRLTQKRRQREETTVEKKRESHPFLYAFSVVILIVIVVTFIGGPVIDRVGGAGRIVFGYYKDKAIEFYPGNFFSERKDIIADQLRQGGEPEQEDLEVQAYQVWRTAFDQTVLHTAILLEAESSGVWISEDRLDETLITSGPYVVDGKFSEARYRSTPSVDRMTTRRLYREQVIHEQYLKDIFLTQRISQREQEFFDAMMREQRRFSFVTFSFESFPDEEIKTFAQANKERFRRIKLSRILIKSNEREAREIRKKLIERTSSFEELARAHSKDVYADKGGDMGFRYHYDLEADFEGKEPVEQIFKLQEGDISKVLESRFGWVIFRCDSPALEPDIEDDEFLQTVRQYVMRYEKGRVEDAILAKAEAFRERVDDVGFLGATLETVYAVGLTDYFPLNYQSFYFLSPVRSPLEQFNLSAATYSEDFFVQAFSLAPGQVSDPILLDDQVLVLRLDDKRQPPKQEQDLLDAYYDYYVQQALEQDLQNELLNPDYIVDNFNETFYEYVFPRQ